MYMSSYFFFKKYNLCTLGHFSSITNSSRFLESFKIYLFGQESVETNAKSWALGARETWVQIPAADPTN